MLGGTYFREEIGALGNDRANEIHSVASYFALSIVHDLVVIEAMLRYELNPPLCAKLGGILEIPRVY